MAPMVKPLISFPGVITVPAYSIRTKRKVPALWLSSVPPYNASPAVLSTSPSIAFCIPASAAATAAPGQVEQSVGRLIVALPKITIPPQSPLLR